jgi:hypothetical protein
MKYIFDFDDVLFQTTAGFRKKLILQLNKVGISEDKISEYILKERLNLFSLKNMVKFLGLPDDLYQDIMADNSDFINHNLIELIKKQNKQDVFVVTYGDEEFQLAKLNSSGVVNLFLPENIFITSGSKKEIIENICTRNKNEKIIFIDDNQKHFNDIDFQKCSNLTTILYTGQDISDLTNTSR